MSLKPPLPPNAILDYRHVYDEGTAASVEDGINFTGAGVTVTDDPTNHRLTVAIPGASVTLGDGSEPYTAVDSLSGTPRSVTDWGPILNAAITAGARRFLFGAYDYPYSTQIDIDAVSGVVFSGATASVGAAGTASRLLWKGGAGSGIALNIRNASNGFVGEDISFAYDNVAYNGTLVKLWSGLGGSNTVGEVQFHRCGFGAVGAADTATPPAFCLLDLQEAVGARIQHCALHGSQWAVRGYPTDTTSNSDDNSFRSCWFSGHTLGVFGNVGHFWNIDDCVFYMGGFGGAGVAITPRVIDSDHTVTDFSRLARFNLRGCRIWDLHDNTQILFRQRVNDPWIANFRENWIFPNTPVQWFKLDGGGSVVIENNEMGAFNSGDPALIDCGNPATAQKNPLVIRNNYWNVGTSAAATQTILNVAGHTNVDVHGNGPSTRHVTQVEREMAHWQSDLVAQKGMVVTNGHANVNIISVEGNDAGGIIFLGVDGGDVPTNTKICDLAFNASDMWPSEPVTWIGSTRHKPAVVLSPLRITGRTSVVTNSVVPEVSDNSQTGFSLYTNGTLVGFAGARYALAYRILML